MVAGVIAASILVGSMSAVSASTSTKTGVAPAMLTRYSLTLVALIKQGLGVGLVTEMLSRAIDMRELRLLPVADADLTRRIGVGRARDRAMSPAAEAFRDLLLRACAGASAQAVGPSR